MLRIVETSTNSKSTKFHNRRLTNEMFSITVTSVAEKQCCRFQTHVPHFLTGRICESAPGGGFVNAGGDSHIVDRSPGRGSPAPRCVLIRLRRGVYVIRLGSRMQLGVSRALPDSIRARWDRTRRRGRDLFFLSSSEFRTRRCIPYRRLIPVNGNPAARDRVIIPPAAALIPPEGEKYSRDSRRPAGSAESSVGNSQARSRGKSVMRNGIWDTRWFFGFRIIVG